MALFIFIQTSTHQYTRASAGVVYVIRSSIHLEDPHTGNLSVTQITVVYDQTKRSPIGKDRESSSLLATRIKEIGVNEH